MTEEEGGREERGIRQGEEGRGVYINSSVLVFLSEAKEKKWEMTLWVPLRPLGASSCGC